MTALCGELYFKIIQSDLKKTCSASESSLESLWEFLNTENTFHSTLSSNSGSNIGNNGGVRGQSQNGKLTSKEVLLMQLQELQQMRANILQKLTSQIDHISKAHIPMITNHYDHTISDIQSRMDLYKLEMMRLHRTVDAHIMDNVLNYFEVLKKEISYSRFNANGDFTEINGKRKQAELFRNMRYFALCLELETSSRIKIVALQQGSTQARRCMKAVIDNIDPQLLNRLGFIGMDVNSVFKLEHKYFSESLQNSAVSAISGKIKGLFCMIPTNSIYNFCVNGIAQQKLFTSSKLKPTKDLTPPGVTSLFKTPWYCFGQSNSHSNDDGDALGSMNNRATIRASAMLKKAFGTGNQLAQSGSAMTLRFSRQSTTSVLFDNLGTSTELCEQGAFVALCRVLICNVKTVKGDISEDVISSAFVDGCDAVFFNSSQEYVLLNPDHILPEFIMHVQFKKVDGAADMAAAERVRRSLVNVPTACIQRSFAQQTSSNISDANDSMSPIPNGLLSRTTKGAEATAGMLDDFNGASGSDLDDGGFEFGIPLHAFGWKKEKVKKASARLNESVNANTVNTPPFVCRNGCAEVFAENLLFRQQKQKIAVPRDIEVTTTTTMSGVGKEADSKSTETIGQSQLEIERLVQTLSEFDSRHALTVKQDIVRGIQESIDIFSSKSREVLRGAFARKRI